MIRVALKAILARRARMVLTSLAIILGVGMVSGALTLSDSLRRAANALTTSSYRGTDAVVDARTVFAVSQQGNASRPTVPASLLKRVRALPQVGTAVGDLTNTQTRIIDAHGSVIGSGPFFGVGFDAATAGSRRLTPFRLTTGHFATRADQVVIDAGTAAKQHVGVGGRVRIEGRGPARDFTVSGIATFGAINSIGSATIAVFDLREAQQLFGEPGRYDSILVAARPGTSVPALRAALTSAIPSFARVQTAAAQDRFTLKGLKQFISIIEIVLLAFGGIAIFVGAFTIFNTLSIAVAQRSRELALLRTVGASRRQVLGSVLLEAVSIGALASVVGLGAGVALATGLSSLMRSLGLALPQAGTVFAAHTVIAALLVGILVTALAGLGPAVRATRIPAVIALREGAVTHASASSRRVVGRVANTLAVLALGLLLAGMFAGGVGVGTRFALIIPGCLLLFVAVAMLSARIAARLASLLGRPAERLGGAAGALARRNAMRNPSRTASTAAALMIGVALVVFVSVIASGLKQSTTGTLTHQIKARYVVAASDGYAPIDPAVARAVAGTAGVTSTSGVAQDEVRAYGHTTIVNGVDPQSIGTAYRYQWQSGSPAALPTLDGSGAVLDSSFATSHHLRVGSRFAVTLADGRSLGLVVRGIDVPPKWGALGLGPVTVSSTAFSRAFPNPRYRLVFVAAAAGARAALQAHLAGFPGVKAYTRSGFANQQLSWVSQMLAMIYVLLALAVIVSLFGIVTTLAMSVFERTRELGMLRAVGMTRRQVRRMVRQESVITALLGATLGIAVGLFLAGMVTIALSGEGLQFALPAGSLVAFVVIAINAGTLAAIAPARRAAKLSPLAALAYE